MKFPYPEGLAQLEGFQLTPLEKEVAGNPSFQYLRSNGWPIPWGKLLTAQTIDETATRELRGYLGSEAHRMISSKEPVLSPHAAGKLVDELAPHLRSVAILAAKIRRDADPEQTRDQELVRDLGIWMDGSSQFNGFCWEHRYSSLQTAIQMQAREARIEESRQGRSQLVILLTAGVPKLQLELRDEALHAKCMEVMDISDRDEMDWWRFTPRGRCICCQDGVDTWGNNHKHTFCLTLADCGDVPTIMSWVPSPTNRQVKPVRFEIDRRTFGDPRYMSNVACPAMLVVDLHLFDATEQRHICDWLNGWLTQKKQQRAKYANRHVLSNTELVKPSGRQKLNAILLTGDIVQKLRDEEISNLFYNDKMNEWRRKGLSITWVGPT